MEIKEGDYIWCKGCQRWELVVSPAEYAKTSAQSPHNLLSNSEDFDMEVSPWRPVTGERVIIKGGNQFINLKDGTEVTVKKFDSRFKSVVIKETAINVNLFNFKPLENPYKLRERLGNQAQVKPNNIAEADKVKVEVQNNNTDNTNNMNDNPPFFDLGQAIVENIIQQSRVKTRPPERDWRY